MVRRLRTGLVGIAAIAALLVPVQAAAADPGGREAPPRGGPTKTFFKLGHSKTKASAAARRAADHTVTIHGIDATGTPVAPLGTLIDPETGVEYPLTESGDALTAVVPAGTYSLTNIVLTGSAYDPSNLALYGNPALTVDDDVELTLDARTATEIQAVSPSSTATEVHSHAQIVQKIAGQDISTIVSGRSDIGLRAWPSASTTRPYHFVYAETQAEPLSTLPTPRVYKLVFPTAGQIPSDLTFEAAPASLALVNTTYAAQGVPSTEAGFHSVIADVEDVGGEALGLTHPTVAPKTQRVYYTANGVKWRGASFYKVGSIQVAEDQSTPRSFTAGGTHSETWNKAAFGPTMKVGHGQGQLLARPLLADTGQPGHENFSGNYGNGTTGTLTLYRNGQKVGESANPMAGDWNVPADPATFRLDLAVNRNVAWSNYATSINARWTFPSAERPGHPLDDQRRLLQPRISGAFDGNGRAPVGTTFPLDVVVERPVGGSAVTLTSVEASFNDGTTWSTVPVTASGTDRWTANILHWWPHNGYVALRVKATDGSGNAVEQTVIRAYGLQ
ncbi:hypothetical protein BZB76_6187 [Actinomadura pelletieri DSM 43383]|uniref:Uncharacterized protein n=1 Tax=Actinomadura pelletieri DSM 43383 TaxID=1120940 RepID=A0A495QBJ9_9ACTN|nr:hypothetical protein [Actinomadura pelletieri]RKS69048.1 hypothetical protein BZB76_6187 [Actinomadura pelletieri DSM 43383]